MNPVRFGFSGVSVFSGDLAVLKFIVAEFVNLFVKAQYFHNGSRDYQPKGSTEQVNVHDFITDSQGRATPYGVYDVGDNSGWVSVGSDHDTPPHAPLSPFDAGGTPWASLPIRTPPRW